MLCLFVFCCWTSRTTGNREETSFKKAYGSDATIMGTDGEPLEAAFQGVVSDELKEEPKTEEFQNN